VSNPDPAEVPVVILCGGQGTRIREASEKLPKPLINVGTQPILWHIMKIYGAHGFRRFVLCLGYKAWDIKQYFLRFEEMMSDLRVNVGGGAETEFLERHTLDDWEVLLMDTGLDTGTGGRLAAVAPQLDQDYFMLTYGDGLGNVDVGLELKTLAASENIGMVTGVHPTSRYGELSVEGDRVASFAEKPASEGWVSGGFFAFRREFLDYVPTSEPLHFFEHQPVHDVTHEGKLGLFPHNGFWMGMDTFREYTALNTMWAEGKAPWKIW
jgi:glucose-1-phosphate cytidylyltransferase